MRKKFRLVHLRATRQHYCSAVLPVIAIDNMKKRSILFYAISLLLSLAANALEDTAYETDEIISDEGKDCHIQNLMISHG